MAEHHSAFISSIKRTQMLSILLIFSTFLEVSQGIALREWCASSAGPNYYSNQSCYRILTTAVNSIYNAMTACKNANGSLARIATETVVKNIFTNMLQSYSNHQVIISVAQFTGSPTPAANFQLIGSKGNAILALNSTANASLYWKPNEPNDGKATTAGPENDQQDCVVLVNNNDGLVGAQDVECTAATPIYQPLCQYDEPILYYSLVVAGGGFTTKNIGYVPAAHTREDCASSCRQHGICRAFNYNDGASQCVIVAENGPVNLVAGWSAYALL